MTTLESSKERIEQEHQLENAVANARQLRSEFLRLYADAVKTLGRFCHEVDEAVSARNALARGYPDPLHNTMLSDISNPQALDVLSTLRSKGFQPCLDFGWDFSFQITPLREKE